MDFIVGIPIFIIKFIFLSLVLVFFLFGCILLVAPLDEYLSERGTSILLIIIFIVIGCLDFYLASVLFGSVSV